jgi:hypothetical protein
MPTNLTIDDKLLDEALSIGGYKTKRETVNEALREFNLDLALHSPTRFVINLRF